MVNDQVDLHASSRVCGPPVNFGLMSCSACAFLNSTDPTSKENCMMSELRCGLLAPSVNTIGCFNNSALAPLEECRGGQCPNQCSGHGTCPGTGVCACNNGWYGDDCSSNEPIFQKCFKVDALSADTCGSIQFTQDCKAEAAVTVAGTPVMQQSWSLSQFETLFVNDGWCQGIPGCQMCINWTNRKLDSTTFSGCASANLACGGQNFQQFLGCYQENDVVPRCFGDCPDYCNFHGICQVVPPSTSKQCVCDQGYTGDTCQITYDGVCPSDLECDLQHSYCNQGECICDPGWTGADCSKEKKGGRNDSKVDTEIIVVVVIVLLVLIGAGAGAFFYYKKQQQKKNKAVFSSHDLEMLDDDDEHGLVDLDN